MSLRSSDERVEFRVRVKRTTEMAVLCHLDTGEEVWFPRSHIDFEQSEVQDEGDIGTIAVSRWIAEQKELV